MKPLEPKSLFARRYEVVRCISTGGMGAVYEVIHLDTKRRRALKVMLPNLLVDDEMRRRFALEAVITANVSSEHLIEVFDAGIEADSGCPFLAMELLDGQDLGKQLASAGALSPPEVVELLRQAARALDRTHAAGIVHRDLKPENLFVARRDDGSPKIKILDFGIAKLLASQAGPTSRALGTPLFMAPEQIDDTLAPVGPAADRYAMAHIAYALLTASPYFSEDAKRADNVLGILLAVARGTAEPASQRAARRGASVPAGFDAWFSRATAREPDARFKSSREMVDALAAAIGGSDAALVPAIADPTPVQANSASTSKPRWSSTELIDAPDGLAKAEGSAQAGSIGRPEGVATRAVGPSPAALTISRPISSPPVAASNTASLDPTVTTNTSTGRKSRVPLLVALSVPAGLALAYFAMRGEPTPAAEPGSAAPQAAQSSRLEEASQTVPASAPLVVPTGATTPDPSSAVVASASNEARTATSANATPGKRPPVLPKATVATAAATVTPNALPWEVRTPVKQP